MELPGVIFIVLVLAAILVILLVLKPFKHTEHPEPEVQDKPLQFDFCVGTYVNNAGVTKKALGVKLQGSSIYYCIKNTVHDIDYTFSNQQIAWFKTKFAKVYSDVHYQDLIYFNGNPVEPIQIV